MVQNESVACFKPMMMTKQRSDIELRRTHLMDGILPKGPYPPCLRMADRALLAGYTRYMVCIVSIWVKIYHIIMGLHCIIEHPLYITHPQTHFQSLYERSQEITVTGACIKSFPGATLPFQSGLYISHYSFASTYIFKELHNFDITVQDTESF